MYDVAEDGCHYENPTREFYFELVTDGGKWFGTSGYSVCVMAEEDVE